MTYDTWKATDSADDLLGPEPPPCELYYPPERQHQHPRYPSGDCVKCGALCTEGCQYPTAKAWEEFQTAE
jgi:hypothetical protein